MIKIDIKRILDVVIVILVFLLVIITAGAINEIFEYSSYSCYDEDSFGYRLQDGDYARMVEMYYDNMSQGAEDKKELQEYYGIAKYFEAASYYKVYITTNDMEKAATQEEKMEAALAQMGELAFVSEQIDAKLGIE